MCICSLVNSSSLSRLVLANTFFFLSKFGLTKLRKNCRYTTINSLGGISKLTLMFLEVVRPKKPINHRKPQKPNSSYSFHYLIMDSHRLVFGFLSSEFPKGNEEPGKELNKNIRHAQFCRVESSWSPWHSIKSPLPTVKRTTSTRSPTMSDRETSFKGTLLVDYFGSSGIYLSMDLSTMWSICDPEFLQSGI